MFAKSAGYCTWQHCYPQHRKIARNCIVHVNERILHATFCIVVAECLSGLNRSRIQCWEILFSELS